MKSRASQVRKAIFLAFIIVGLYFTGLNFASATKIPHSCAQDTNTTPREADRSKIISTYCSKTKTSIILSFDSANGVSTLTNGIRKSTLDIIKKNYRPGIVGGEQYMRFLPASAQIYENRALLLYLSARRSTGGGGGGQCGAGLEIFLNVLNLKTSARVGRVLVSSCLKNIELSSSATPDDPTESFKGAGDKIAIDFLNYGDMPGSPTGYLSSDLSKIEFH